MVFILLMLFLSIFYSSIYLATISMYVEAIIIFISFDIIMWISSAIVLESCGNITCTATAPKLKCLEENSIPKMTLIMVHLYASRLWNSRLIKKSGLCHADGLGTGISRAFASNRSLFKCNSSFQWFTTNVKKEGFLFAYLIFVYLLI